MTPTFAACTNRYDMGVLGEHFEGHRADVVTYEMLQALFLSRVPHSSFYLPSAFLVK